MGPFEYPELASDSYSERVRPSFEYVESTTDESNESKSVTDPSNNYARFNGLVPVLISTDELQEYLETGFCPRPFEFHVLKERFSLPPVPEPPQKWRWTSFHPRKSHRRRKNRRRRKVESDNDSDAGSDTSSTEKSPHIPSSGDRSYISPSESPEPPTNHSACASLEEGEYERDEWAQWLNYQHCSPSDPPIDTPALTEESLSPDSVESSSLPPTPPQIISDEPSSAPLVSCFMSEEMEIAPSLSEVVCGIPFFEGVRIWEDNQLRTPSPPPCPFIDPSWVMPECVYQDDLSLSPLTVEEPAVDSMDVDVEPTSTIWSIFADSRAESPSSSGFSESTLPSSNREPSIRRKKAGACSSRSHPKKSLATSSPSRSKRRRSIDEDDDGDDDDYVPSSPRNAATTSNGRPRPTSSPRRRKVGPNSYVPLPSSSPPRESDSEPSDSEDGPSSTGERRYRCDQCPKDTPSFFTRLCDLKRHIEGTHQGIRYRCLHCLQNDPNHVGFHRTDALRRHLSAKKKFVECREYFEMLFRMEHKRIPSKNLKAKTKWIIG